MPAQPHNCFICKNTWLGSGPICDDCKPAAKNYSLPCKFCGSYQHDEATCVVFRLQQQNKSSFHAAKYNPFMAQRTVRRSKPFTNFYADQGPPLKTCVKCKMKAVLETKAGRICTHCKAVTHNPCRNCTSTATHGLGGDGMQFIECNDCQFME